MTDSQKFLRDFEKFGYCIVPADDRAELDQLRSDIRDVLYDQLKVKSGDVQNDLDQIHRHCGDSAEIDRLRLAITPIIAEKSMANRRIFAAFRSKLTSLVGQDVLAQRVPNVVLQPPNHPTPTELHRDAPANSPYEVVVWLPLVDCHDSKSMYILNRESTRTALDLYRLNPDDAEAFEGLLDARAELVNVPYGSALLFWSALFHGSQVNTESETRVSLNTRYKHLFAPLGMKDPFRYFEMLQTTELTRLGLSFQRSEDM